jgi:myo-inositol catabolism protein IolC
MFRDLLPSNSDDADRLMRETKEIVLDGLLLARDDQRLASARLGLLIDEELGAAAIHRAHAEEISLILPIERSGAPTFTLEYGQEFLAHLEAFPVDIAKVLVFINPAGDQQAYRGQIERMRDALGRVKEAGYPIMVEVIVPPTSPQLASVSHDNARFDREVRPALVTTVITDCYEAGLRPEFWKLEGLESPEDYASVSKAILSHDPTARALVLGRAAPEPKVVAWLALAATTPGFAGFAVGRSIWQEALGGWLAGRTPRADAAALIAANFSSLSLAYLNARRQTAM